MIAELKARLLAPSSVQKKKEEDVKSKTYQQIDFNQVLAWGTPRIVTNGAQDSKN